MEFPKMIYLGGEHGAEHRIVADQAEQDAAKADGFLQLGETARAPAPAPAPEPAVQAAPVVEQIAAPAVDASVAAAPAPAAPAAPAVDEKAQLIAALEAAGIEHKKSWGAAKLREALEGNAE